MVPYGRIGGLIHEYAPHSSVTLYIAAAASAAIAVASVFIRCWWTKSTGHLEEKWLFRTATAAAPIPTYFLLIILPIDPDLATSVLDDRVVVALAGLYGLTEAFKDVRDMASKAHRSRHR